MRISFLAGDLEQALLTLREAGRVLDPVELLDEVVAPAMHDVGALWESAMVSVADEHLATATLHRMLAEVAVLRPRAQTFAGTAVLATSPAERHSTPLLLVDSVLRGAGWHVRNLGTGVPLGDLEAFLAREQPDLVGVSCTMSCQEIVDTIAIAHRAAPRARVLVGGRGIVADPPAPAEHVRDLRGMLAALGS